MIPSRPIALSGERFEVTYRLTGDQAEAHAKARDIALEQTVEFPAALLPAGDIPDAIVGRIERMQQLDEQHHEAVISYAAETSGFELTQLLNVIFGNSSIKPGIRVERLALPPSLRAAFNGPRFGRAGIRARLGVPERPLLCTALKPMGLPVSDLAELAYQCALGGIDLIKDDHGLADQPFAPFEERVQRCVEAVERANRETGMRCVYVPNISAPADRVLRNARFAKAAGAGGLLIAAGLTGWDTLRLIADDDAIDLPLINHPALLGSFVTSADNGISHGLLFGLLARLAGADATIYPNYGGRFSFSRAECQAIVEAAAQPVGQLKPIFPAPGGGMSLERVPEMRDLYGREVIFLIGGGLHSHGPDLAENCRHFRRMVERM